MKTTISVPDHIFGSAEQLASLLGISRSELYSKALAELVEKHRDELITDRLNEIYDPNRETLWLDAEIASLQHRALARGNR